MDCPRLKTQRGEGEGIQCVRDLDRLQGLRALEAEVLLGVLGDRAVFESSEEAVAAKRTEPLIESIASLVTDAKRPQVIGVDLLCRDCR
jgi:hypothetical protein